MAPLWTILCVAALGSGDNATTPAPWSPSGIIRGNPREGRMTQVIVTLTNRTAAEQLLDEAKCSADEGKAPHSVRGMDVVKLAASSLGEEQVEALHDFPRWKVTKVTDTDWQSNWTNATRDADILGASERDATFVLEPTLKRAPGGGDPESGSALSPMLRHPLVQSYIQQGAETHQGGVPGRWGYYPMCWSTQRACLCWWQCTQWPVPCLEECRPHRYPPPTPPPPPDWTGAWSNLYNKITNLKNRYISMHTRMKNDITPLVNEKARSDKGEQWMPIVTSILGNNELPPPIAEIPVGNEPSPFDAPVPLATWLAYETEAVGVMSEIAKKTLEEDVEVLTLYLAKYSNFMVDLERVGAVSKKSSENMAMGALTNALGTRSGDHEDMIAEETDLIQMMSSVEAKLMLKTDQAKLKQSNMYERVRNFMLAKAEQEKVAAEELRKTADHANNNLKKNEEFLEKYSLDVNANLDKTKEFIDSIDMTSKLSAQMGEQERNIGEKDTAVKDAAAQAITDLTTIMTENMNAMTSKYEDIRAKAQSLSIIYPEEFADIDTVPVNAAIESALASTARSDAAMSQALTDTITKARNIAYEVNQKAISVIKRFESNETAPFKYADIEPSRFNELFTSTGATVAAQPYDGWTVADIPKQRAAIDAAINHTQAWADQDLAELKAQSAKRLAFVEAEVGNTTQEVEAQLAEVEQNATETEAKAKASNDVATALTSEAEFQENVAKSFVQTVDVAATTAKDAMNLRLSDSKDAITRGISDFGEDSAAAVEELKKNISRAVGGIRGPIQAQVDSTVNHLESNLATLSGGWDSNLTWLEGKLGELQTVVSKYIGGHKALQKLTSEGQSDIDAARYNLMKNDEKRKATKVRLDEQIDMAKQSIMMWTKNELSTTTGTIRGKLRERNKELYDRMGKVGRLMQQIEGEFTSNQNELSVGMKKVHEKVAVLSETLTKANDNLDLDKGVLGTTIQTIKDTIRQLEQAHSATLDKAKQAMQSSLEASEGRNAAIYKDADTYMQDELAKSSTEAESAITDASTEITNTFDQSTGALNDQIANAQQNAEDMTFNAKTVGQTLAATNDEVNDEAESMIASDEAAVQTEENAVSKLGQEANFVQKQLTSGAENSLSFEERGLMRERGVLEEHELEAAQTLANYLQSMGMSEQHALDLAAQMVQQTAAGVHQDETAAAEGLRNITTEFEQTEDGVANVVNGVSQQGNQTNAAFGNDFAAIDGASSASSSKNSDILLATEGELANMEQNADAAGSNLLDAVDAKAGELEEQNQVAFKTVEDAIEAGEEVLAEGRQKLKNAGAQLRSKATGLTDALDHYKSNVTEQIALLAALNNKENRTLAANVQLLRGYMEHTFAVEEKMLDQEQKRIDDERTAADQTFDQSELDIQGFAAEVSKLMNSDAFQMLKKIMQADQDVALVTRENEDFVTWVTEHEETSIPWMRDVLKALAEAHDEKLREEYKKEMEEKALAAHEEEQAARSFNSVEGLVAGAGAAMGADEFSQMKKSSERLLGGVSATKSDAGLLSGLEDEAAAAEREGQREIDAASSEVKATNAQVAAAGYKTKEVQTQLESIIAAGDKQTDGKMNANENDLRDVTESILASSIDLGHSKPPGALLERGRAGSLVEWPAAPSSFVEDGDGDAERVNATEIKEWLNLLKNTQQLSDNYTTLRQHHMDLGFEITHLRDHISK